MKRPCLYMGIAMAICAVGVGHASLSGSFCFLFAGISGILWAAFLLGGRKWQILRWASCVFLGATILFLSAGINERTCLTPARKLAGREDVCLLQVRGIPADTAYGKSCEVRLLSVGEEACRLEGLFYYEEGDFLPGDLISLHCKADLASENGSVNLRRLYASRGQYITLRGGENPERVGQKRDILLYPLYLGAKGRRTVSEYLPGEKGNILSGILFGGSQSLSERFSDAASRCGVSHMFAVSGMHLSVLCGGLLLVFRKRNGVFFLIPFCLVFAVMTGMTPSVIRAMIVVLLPLLGPYLGRDADPFNTLGFALCLLLGANPWQIFSMSLQFSFGAVLGLFLYGDRIYTFLTAPVKGKGRWRFAPWRWLCAGISAYISANVFCLPILAVTFRSIPVLGLLANLGVVWMLPFLFSGGFLLWFLSVSFPAGAGLLARGLEKLIALLEGVVLTLGELPHATFGLREIPLTVWFFASYGVLMLLLVLKKRPTHRWLIATVLSLVCTLSGMALWGKSHARADFLSVGNGQCAVLTADRTAVMLDCGGANAENIALSYLDGMNIGSLDLLVLSHTDADHINGVEALLSRGRVKKLVLSEYAAEDEKGKALLALAEKEGTEIRVLEKTDTLALPGISLTLYTPTYDSAQKCLMAGVRIFETGLFFAEDMNIDDEMKLLYRYDLPACRILCVAHHGSEDGTGIGFLKKLSPKDAIISVGENSYGHPSPETLSRLSEQNVNVYTTLESGDISVSISKAGYRIR